MLKIWNQVIMMLVWIVIINNNNNGNDELEDLADLRVDYLLNKSSETRGNHLDQSFMNPA